MVLTIITLFETHHNTNRGITEYEELYIQDESYVLDDTQCYYETLNQLLTITKYAYQHDVINEIDYNSHHGNLIHTSGILSIREYYYNVMIKDSCFATLLNQHTFCAI
jgi:hypothetical protein